MTMLTAAQLAERTKGIGGSDAAAVLGLSRFKTQRQLYHEKRGEYPLGLDESPESEVIWWGRALEPIVRQKYAEKTGRTVRVPPGTLHHHSHDFMLAHIDGFSTEPGTKPIEPANCRGYEGKTAMLSTGWGEEGTDEIPRDYLIQVHHYLAVTGFPVFDVCCLIGRRFKAYEVPRDEEMVGMLIEAERAFWERVRNGDPPPLDFEHKTALDVTKKLHPGTNGMRVVASADAINWRAQLEAANKALAAAKATADAMKARLLEEMGDAALLAFPDGKCYRRQKITRAPYSVEETTYIDARFINDGKAPALRAGR